MKTLVYILIQVSFLLPSVSLNGFYEGQFGKSYESDLFEFFLVFLNHLSNHKKLLARRALGSTDSAPLLQAGGKPSTRLPPEGLVEHTAHTISFKNHNNSFLNVF